LTNLAGKDHEEELEIITQDEGIFHEVPKYRV